MMESIIVGVNGRHLWKSKLRRQRDGNDNKSQGVTRQGNKCIIGALWSVILIKFCFVTFPSFKLFLIDFYYTSLGFLANSEFLSLGYM